MMDPQQQRDLDALTKMAYDCADKKVTFAAYREAEKAYVAKYGGN
jgi:hypothetical protein